MQAASVDNTAPSVSVMSLVQDEAERNAWGGEVLTRVPRGFSPYLTARCLTVIVPRQPSSRATVASVLSLHLSPT